MAICVLAIFLVIGRDRARISGEKEKEKIEDGIHRETQGEKEGTEGEKEADYSRPVTGSVDGEQSPDTGAKEGAPDGDAGPGMIPEAATRAGPMDGGGVTGKESVTGNTEAKD